MCETLKSVDVGGPLVAKAQYLELTMEIDVLCQVSDLPATI